MMDGVTAVAPAAAQAPPAAGHHVQHAHRARGPRRRSTRSRAGASDYVTKPANVGSVAESMDSIRTQLIPKLKALVAARARPSAPRLGPAGPAAAPPAAGHRRRGAAGRCAGPAGADRAAAARIGGRAGHRVVHRRTRRADQHASRSCRPTSRCLSCSCSTCRRSSPGCSPSGSTTKSSCRCGRRRTANRSCRGRCTSHPAISTCRWSAAARRCMPCSPRREPENFCRPAADVLFRSVARATAGRALAVGAHRHGPGRGQGCGAMIDRRRQDIRAGRGDIGGVGHAGRGVAGRPGRAHPPAARHRFRAAHRLVGTPGPPGRPALSGALSTASTASAMTQGRPSWR